MRETIKEVFLGAPTFGDDPIKQIFIPIGTGGVTAAVYSDAQLAARLGTLLKIATPVAGVFAMVMTEDNSTVAAYSSNFVGAYDKHFVTVSNEIPSGPDMGLDGIAKGSIDLGDFYSHFGEMWTYVIDTDIWTKMTPAVDNGLGGFPIQGIYRLTPPAINDLTVTPQTAGSGSAIINFTPVVVVDGQKSIELIMTDSNTGGSIGTRLGVVPGQAIINIPIEVSVDFVVVVTANNDEKSYSNSVSSTLPSDTSATADGELYIVQSPTRYEVDEDGSEGTLDISIGLRGRVSTIGNVTVEVTTKNGTAKAGENFSALASPTTITFLPGETVKTLPITVIDNLEGYTPNFQVQLVPESVTSPNGTAVIAAFPEDTTLAWITATGIGGSGTAYAIRNDIDDGQIAAPTTGFIIDTRNFTGSDNKGQTGIDLPVVFDKDLLDGIFPNIDGNNFDYLGVDNAGRDYNYNADPLLSYRNVAPIREWELDFGVGNQGTYWLKPYAYGNATWRTKFWIGLDGLPIFSNGEDQPVKVALTTNQRWNWSDALDGGNVPIKVTINSDGIHKLSYWPNNAGCFIGRFALVKDTDFDAKYMDTASTLGVDGTALGDPPPEAWGPDENIKVVAGTVVTDDAANLTATTRPTIPTNDITPTYSVSVGDTVDLQQAIYITFPAGSGLIQVETPLVESDGVNAIQGTTSISGNVITWRPTQPRTEATSYTLTGLFTLVDNVGDPRTGPVSISFNAVDNSSSDIFLDLNPSQWPIDHDMTREELTAWIGTDGAARTQEHLDNGGIRNVLCPFGSGAPVWKVFFKKDFNGTVNGGFLFQYNFSGLDEVYFMTEVAFCTEQSDGVRWKSPASIHMTSVASKHRPANPTSQGGVIAINDWSETQQLDGRNIETEALWAPETFPAMAKYIQDHNLITYSYHQKRSAVSWYPSLTQLDTPYGPAPVDGQTHYTPGEYTVYKTRVKMNTPGVADGKLHVWVNGKLAMYLNNVTWRGAGADSTSLVSQVQFRMYSGGPVGNQKYFHSQDQWCYFKNFKISKSDIGQVVPVNSGMFERDLVASGTYANAYKDVAVTATFTHTGSHPQVVVKGFWDGNSRWKVRFTPPVTGVWNYSINNDKSDSGLTGTGSFNITAVDKGFVRANGRGYVFDDGSKYFMLGATSYDLLDTALSGKAWKPVIDFLRTKNINKLRILLQPFTQSSPKYSNFAPYGGTTSSLDHDNLNIAFWQTMDEVLAYAAAKGMVVDLIVFKTSPTSFGTAAQDARYIRYAIARYAAYTNVIWNITNEYQNNASGVPYKSIADFNVLGNIVYSEDPYMTNNASGKKRILGIHGKHTATKVNDFKDEVWNTHVICQDNLAWMPNGANADAEAQLQTVPNYLPGKPMAADEYAYDGMYLRNNQANYFLRKESRLSTWAMLLGGAYPTIGDGYLQDGSLEPLDGNLRPLSNWVNGEYYDREFYNDIARVFTFWTTKGLDFPSMTPDNALVTAGTRVYGTKISGNQYVFYAAVGGPFTVNLAAGTYTATRYDPATGIESALGSVGGGTQSFVMPNTNDWVVYLK